MRVYLGVSNHLSPLKAESFLYLVAEVEARDLKQKKDLLYYVWFQRWNRPCEKESSQP